MLIFCLISPSFLKYALILLTFLLLAFSIDAFASVLLVQLSFASGEAKFRTTPFKTIYFVLRCVQNTSLLAAKISF